MHIVHAFIFPGWRYSRVRLDGITSTLCLGLSVRTLLSCKGKVKVFLVIKVRIFCY